MLQRNDFGLNDVTIKKQVIGFISMVDERSEVTDMSVCDKCTIRSAVAGFRRRKFM